MNNPAGVLVSLYLSSPLLFSFALLTHRLFFFGVFCFNGVCLSESSHLNLPFHHSSVFLCTSMVAISGFDIKTTSCYLWTLSNTRYERTTETSPTMQEKQTEIKSVREERAGRMCEWDFWKWLLFPGVIML